MATLIQQIDNSFDTVCSFILNDKFKDGLSRLKQMAESTRNADFVLECEEMQRNYRMLLDYNFRGTPDPQRDSVYRKLKVSALELADKVHQQQIVASGMNIGIMKRQFEKEKENEKEEAAKRFDTYSFDLEFTRLLSESDLVTAQNESSIPVITPKIFQLIWLSEKYTDTDLQLIQAIRTSTSLPWYEKCLAVSGLTLSLINCFDKEKFLALCDFYDDRQPQVWQRAFTGLIACALLYDRRLELYPALKTRFDALNLKDQYADDLRSLLIRFLKALETEKITREFRNEILPDVQKFESKLREKLDLDNIINNELIEDKNPDWEQIFEDSPDLLNKIEKMSEMQMDGLDLFMGTFSMLKNFDFFREISNWFRPFYKENPDAAKAVGDSTEGRDAFLAGLEDSFYMCNSDKYSFCFNINYLPADQSKNVIGLFNMEADNMREIRNEDSLLHKSDADSYIFTQYTQDLYRFYKLYPFRTEFRDVFGLNWDLQNSWLIGATENNTPLIRTCAEFYFEKEHFGQAAELYQTLLSNGDPDQALIEKTAYSFQRIGRYAEAVNYYKQAELFDTNRLWSLKKLIFCYRKLGDNLAALEWAVQAETLAPDDSYVQTMLGNCYLDSQDYEKALGHYFKSEFLQPETCKVQRPIAWCSFVLKKYDVARNYFLQIVDKEAVASDYLNLGHIELCDGDKNKAIGYYLKAIEMNKNDFKWFSDAFGSDRNYLIANGISAFELQLTEDFLRYRADIID